MLLCIEEGHETYRDPTTGQPLDTKPAEAAWLSLWDDEYEHEFFFNEVTNVGQLWICGKASLRADRIRAVLCTYVMSMRMVWQVCLINVLLCIALCSRNAHGCSRTCATPTGVDMDAAVQLCVAQGMD
jgi:hypothetical protein